MGLRFSGILSISQLSRARRQSLQWKDNKTLKCSLLPYAFPPFWNLFSMQRRNLLSMQIEPEEGPGLLPQWRAPHPLEDVRSSGGNSKSSGSWTFIITYQPMIGKWGCTAFLFPNHYDISSHDSSSWNPGLGLLNSVQECSLISDLANVPSFLHWSLLVTMPRGCLS